MKKIFKFMLVALAAATVFTACKDEETNYDPIDAQFESPRCLAAHDGSIYVTCYNPRAVVRIDTTNMKPTGICQLGDFNPEGIAAVGNKLYVASSNMADENYNYTYDDKLYIVDASTMTVSGTITVGKNPARVLKLDGNHVVVNCLGDYATDFGGTYVVNTSNKEVTPLNVALYNMTVHDGNIYGYTSPYGTLKFYRIDGNSLNATEILTSWNSTDNPYGISVNSSNGDLIVTTDGNYSAAGDCYVYTNSGDVRSSAIEMGNLPSRAIGLDADNLLVLNEGGWGSNNAGISKVDVQNKTAENSWFDAANGRGLGDVAQDIMKYGSRVYVTVTFSNSIEAVNPQTGKSNRMATAK